jgi:hypothetical protein
LDRLLLEKEGNSPSWNQRSVLKKNGPDPVFPAMVSSEDFRKVPEPLRSLVRAAGK